jgi:hypothetical protein
MFELFQWNGAYVLDVEKLVNQIWLHMVELHTPAKSKIWGPK